MALLELDFAQVGKLRSQGLTTQITGRKWRTLRSVRERLLKDIGKPFLPAWYPLRVVSPHHFHGVADEFSHIRVLYAPFKQDASERVSESVRTRFLFKRPCKPKHLL